MIHIIPYVVGADNKCSNPTFTGKTILQVKYEKPDFTINIL